MKKLLLSGLVLFFTVQAFAQAKLLSYDDINYLLHNNISKADTFFNAKGYTLAKKDEKKKLRSYALNINGGTYNKVNLRSDGKRLYIEIDTNEPAQYNMIYNSIAQYVDKQSTNDDVQLFKVKDVGEIYIMTNDGGALSPIRKEYYIRIASDKSITAYN
ncbi:hypothetical protein ACFQZX_10980 [Mucilaginibacter litoreus]|uniref:Uncharacterized protein n=1 Tax=Mucilaginibacter litoreus TaxID=1048221 RepID=A0ABW3ATQ2_9SPHI